MSRSRGYSGGTPASETGPPAKVPSGSLAAVGQVPEVLGHVVLECRTSVLGPDETEVCYGSEGLRLVGLEVARKDRDRLEAHWLIDAGDALGEKRTYRVAEIRAVS